MCPAASGEMAPTFQSVSGSGAGTETILHLDHILPKIPRFDRKGSPETMRFLARFWVLFPRGKSTPPEAGQADSITNPPPEHIAPYKNTPAG